MANKAGLVPRKVAQHSKSGKIFEALRMVDPTKMFSTSTFKDAGVNTVRKVRSKLEQTIELSRVEVDKWDRKLLQMNSTLDRAKERGAEPKKITKYEKEVAWTKNRHEDLIAGLNKLKDVMDNIQEEMKKRVKSPSDRVKLPYIEHQHKGRQWHPIEEQHDKEQVQREHIEELQQKPRPHEDLHRHKGMDYWHHEDYDHKDSEGQIDETVQDAHNDDLEARGKLETPWYTKMGIKMEEVAEGEHYRFKSPKDSDFQTEIDIKMNPDSSWWVGERGKGLSKKFTHESDALEFVRGIFEDQSIEGLKRGKNNGANENPTLEKKSFENGRLNASCVVLGGVLAMVNEEIEKREESEFEVTILEKKQGEDGLWIYKCEMINGTECQN